MFKLEVHLDDEDPEVANEGTVRTHLKTKHRFIVWFLKVIRSRDVRDRSVYDLMEAGKIH